MEAKTCPPHATACATFIAGITLHAMWASEAARGMRGMRCVWNVLSESMCFLPKIPVSAAAWPHRSLEKEWLSPCLFVEDPFRSEHYAHHVHCGVSLVLFQGDHFVILVLHMRPLHMHSVTLCCFQKDVCANRGSSTNKKPQESKKQHRQQEDGLPSFLRKQHAIHDYNSCLWDSGPMTLRPWRLLAWRVDRPQVLIWDVTYSHFARRRHVMALLKKSIPEWSFLELMCVFLETSSETEAYLSGVYALQPDRIDHHVDLASFVNQPKLHSDCNPMPRPNLQSLVMIKHDLPSTRISMGNGCAVRSCWSIFCHKLLKRRASSACAWKSTTVTELWKVQPCNLSTQARSEILRGMGSRDTFTVNLSTGVLCQKTTTGHPKTKDKRCAWHYMHLDTWNDPSSIGVWLKANHRKRWEHMSCIPLKGINIPSGEDLFWQIRSLPAKQLDPGLSYKGKTKSTSSTTWVNAASAPWPPPQLTTGRH